MPLNSPTPSVQALPDNTPLREGHYILEKVLGSGGSGITYRALDTGLQRPVAIKEFIASGSTRNGSHLTSGDTSVSQANKEQFLDESRTLAKFQHKNIVKVISAFEENNTVYLVMEYLDGQSLQSLVESQGRLALDAVIAHLTPVAHALEFVHKANLVHRDIKPGNIMVCNDGRVVLIDFGLKEWIIPQDNYQTQLLKAATCFGTPGYAPPEQYSRHGDISIQTDVYALGATCYFLLTGQAPVDALERAMGMDLIPPRQLVPSLNLQVNDAILKSLELQKEKRHPTPQHFLAALEAPGKHITPATGGAQGTTQLSPSLAPQTRKTVSATLHGARLLANCPYCHRVNTLSPSAHTAQLFECFSCHEKFDVDTLPVTFNHPVPVSNKSQPALPSFAVAALKLMALYLAVLGLFLAIYVFTGATFSDNFFAYFFLLVCVVVFIRWIKARMA